MNFLVVIIIKDEIASTYNMITYIYFFLIRYQSTIIIVNHNKFIFFNHERV